jgi:hypothetical protein
MFIISCNKDKDETSQLTPEQEQIQTKILSIQSNNYNLFKDLIQDMDTLSAKDSVLNVFLADTSVDWARINDQGIAVQYNSGILGGLMIDPKMHPEIDTGDLELYYDTLGLSKYKNVINLKSTSDYILPAHQRTLFICPVYNEFSTPVNILMDKYDEYFSKTRYWIPERDINDDASVEKFTFLENYGIVIIYTHGAVWPCEEEIWEVYIQTGEIVNGATSSRYWRYINTGLIPLIYVEDESYYFLSPRFITEYNNFAKDTTLIYGGFCYSALGSWPEEMINAGAGGYFGYSWATFACMSDAWQSNLFRNLCDTTRGKPMSCNEWITDKKTIKAYKDDEIDKIVYIKYFGIPNLVLWKRNIEEYKLTFWLQNLEGNFKFTDPWDAVSYFSDEVDFAVYIEYVTGYLSGNQFSATWQDLDVGLSEKSNGTFDATFNKDFNTITDFEIVVTRTDYDWTYYYEVKGNNISATIPKKRYRSSGMETCNDVTFKHWYKLVDNSGTWMNYMETFDCKENDPIYSDSYVEIIFTQP